MNEVEDGCNLMQHISYIFILFLFHLFYYSYYFLFYYDYDYYSFQQHCKFLAHVI